MHRGEAKPCGCRKQRERTRNDDPTRCEPLVAPPEEQSQRKQVGKLQQCEQQISEDPHFRRAQVVEEEQMGELAEHRDYDALPYTARLFKDELIVSTVHRLD